MTKDEAIYHIQNFYPADSEYPDTAEIGRELLAQAKNDIPNWRNESEDVLVRYAQLCLRRHGE